MPDLYAVKLRNFCILTAQPMGSIFTLGIWIQILYTSGKAMLELSVEKQIRVVKHI